ncbi:MAG: phenylacetate--CoA ligase family protein [Gammaproteobacteria bacterium]|nr:phenylacetate--CoA ligase family protein [Gammaproteobacteria bacterium]
MLYWNEELETLPWDAVERWQAGQLAPFLGALRQRSALYRDQWRDLPAELAIERFEDLGRLPFTTKQAVRDAQDRAADEMPLGAGQAVPTRDLVQVISSSGTTGAPLYYGLTAADVDRMGDAIANNFFTAGIRPDDVVAHLVGLPMLAGGLPYADAFRRIGAALCWLGGFPTDRILREMRRLRVTALLATTSFALYLSEEWAASAVEGSAPSRLAKVLCGGEPGLDQPEVRRKIEDGLSITTLRDTMGLGDMIPGMWGECEAHSGMHFNAQKHVAVELVDPDSGARVPWREGATGELVYTALARDATPLVRYRSRDHALVTGAERCACGRTSPRIRCIGRTDDMLIYRGMNVFPTAIRDVLVKDSQGRLDPAVRIWKESAQQVRFEEAIQVDAEAVSGVPADAYAALARELEAQVRAQLQVRIALSVLPPGSLPRSVYKNSLLAVRGAP